MGEIKLGTWSVILLLGSLHGLVVAGLLLRSRRNRIANRCLAALLLAVVLLVTPYTIGYAGIYDAWPWLTYTPFFWQLGFGPLIWLYVRQLGQSRMPERWRWHFLPAVMQGIYFSVLFMQPLTMKWQWEASVHKPLVAPLLDGLVFVSLTVYWWLAYRAYVGYQEWLEQHSGAREEYRLHWLRGFLCAHVIAMAVNLGFTVTERFFLDLDYFDPFPLYLSFVLLVYYLGIEGWRHASDAFPQPLPVALRTQAAAVLASERDWAALGRDYERQVADAGWWRDPDLDLPGLARRLGTNTLYLSRALNEGLGRSFSEFINRQRVDAARQLLAGDRSILEIAGDVGFGSKASFNRAFRAYAGCTPSEFGAERLLHASHSMNSRGD